MMTESRIKTALVTGQSNQWHNWKVSHLALRQILEESGRFEVDLICAPEAGGDMSGFSVDWADYDLVVLDYEGDAWPRATRAAFEDFVSGGGGVVVYHAADNAFADWPAYNEMIGVGGWGGRDENAGVMARWREGRVQMDASPASAMHPAPFDFVVSTREPEHPIMKGLPNEWLHARDELYSQLRGPAKSLSVLASAIADPGVIEGGTGEHEPMLMAIKYGEGRVFHTTLGHVGANDTEVPDCLKCVGFITTLVRGGEWAAKGAVTVKIPDDFPGSDAVSLREI